METGNLKAIVHIVTVATDKDPLIHLMAINSGGSVLYLYIHQVSQEKVQLNSSIKTFPRFSPKPPALKPLRTRLPPVRRLLPFGAALAAVHVADAAVLPPSNHVHPGHAQLHEVQFSHRYNGLFLSRLMRPVWNFLSLAASPATQELRSCCELVPHSLPAICSWAVPVAAVTLLSDCDISFMNISLYNCII